MIVDEVTDSAACNQHKISGNGQSAVNQLTRFTCREMVECGCVFVW